MQESKLMHHIKLLVDTLDNIIHRHLIHVVCININICTMTGLWVSMTI